MRTALEITKRELRSLFYSPVGWLVLVVYTIQLGSLLSYGIALRTLRVWVGDSILSLTFNMLSGLLKGTMEYVFLYIPLITMGLLSREYHEGTIKLLFSSPVNANEIVAGKFLSMMVYALLLVGVLGLFGSLMGLFLINHFDFVLLLAVMLIFYLLICTYAAIGLFISSLTSYQFVAALGTVGLLFGLDYIGGLATDGMPEFVVTLLSWFKGISFLSKEFKGFIGSWDVLYFIIVIALFLGLTLLRLQSMRDSKPIHVKIGKYTLLICVALVLGYITSRPALRYYVDVRNTELLDTTLKVGKADVSKWKAMLMYIVPAPLVLVGVTSIVKRRKR